MTKLWQIVWRYSAVLITAIAYAFLASAPTAVMAQDDDPLALKNVDTDRSRQVLAEDFAGVWRVTHIDEDGQSLSGRAEVSADGTAIDLTLLGPEGEVRYELVEADAIRFAEGTGPFIASLIARFKKVAATADESDAAEPLVLDEMRIALPVDHEFIIFAERAAEDADKETIELNLPVAWSDGDQDRIRVSLSTRQDDAKYTGTWMEERGREFKGGGEATWIKGGLSVEGVLVIENQVEPISFQGTNYPFSADGSPIEHILDERTLVVYGRNLPEFASGADIQSLAEHVEYRPVFSAGNDKQELIAKAFAAAGMEQPEDSDAFLLKAELRKNILPGMKSFSVDGEEANWPLIFANQMARFRFTRSSNEPTMVFYVSDVGYVQLSFIAEIPFEKVDVLLLRGDERPVEVGVLTATKIDPYENDPGFTTYQTEPFHLVSNSNPELRPPSDDKALSISVARGMVLRARLLDKAEAMTLPPTLKAEVFDDPAQLGSLWTEALDRVAACYEETVEDYDAYAGQEATTVSKTVLTSVMRARNPATDEYHPDLGGRNDVRLLKGDHAAALLIADEFVSMTMQAMRPYDQLALNRRRPAALIAAARENPNITRSEFWQESKATYVEEGMIWDTKTEVALVDVLDTAAIAQRFKISPEKAEEWAEQQVKSAATTQSQKMQGAASKALDAADCDLAELLVISGHRAAPVIARIMPRLVKRKVDQGPPKREYWVADTVAQAYVKGLYIAGGAVRALEEFSDFDTSVSVAAASIATMGVGAGLELVGYASAAMWANLTATAADLALGGYGVKQYIDGENFYDFAMGASATMGDEIAFDALAARKSALMTAVGVLLPAGVGAYTARNLRNFKSVQAGKALLQSNLRALDDLSKLSAPERTALAGYYEDLLARARSSGVSKLDDADRVALESFDDYFRSRDVVPPNSSSTSPNTRQMASEIDDARSAGPSRDPRLDDTLDEAPPTRDPRLEDTLDEAPPIDPRIDPRGKSLAEVLRNQPIDDSAPLAIPAGALEDFAALEPGVLSRHLSADEVRRLFDPDRVLTRYEILQKADLIRDGRVPLSVAQGDPEVLRAFDAAFGLKRNRPAVTDNGTIIDSVRPEAGIESGPGSVSRSADTVIDSDTSGVSPTADTVIEPGPRNVSTTSDTVIDSSPGGGGGGVRLQPEFIEENVRLRSLIANEDLADQLARIRATEEAAFAADRSRTGDRLTRLGDAQEMLMRGTPEQLQAASQIDQAMRALGASEFDAMAHSSLFYKRVNSLAVVLPRLSPKMEQAQIVAHGFILYGRRPISIGEFASANNISHIAARSVIEDVSKYMGIPQSGPIVVPGSLFR